MKDLAVPRVVHQIWLEGEPPPAGLKWMAEVERLAWEAGWGYELWDYERLVSELPAFLEMQGWCPSVQHQADVGRWLILHEQGGLYLDCDVELFRLPVALEGMWIQGTGGPFVNCAILAAPPGHRHLRAVLDLAAQAGIDRKEYCRFGGGNHFHLRAMDSDVHIWEPCLWDWEARLKHGYGVHHGKFNEWRSLRPAER